MRQVYGTKVTRLTLGGLPLCLVLPALRGAGMGRQMSAEAIVAEPIGEGPNMIAGWSPVLRDDRRHRQRG
jgi:hypothetical protein